MPHNQKENLVTRRGFLCGVAALVGVRLLPFPPELVAPEQEVLIPPVFVCGLVPPGPYAISNLLHVLPPPVYFWEGERLADHRFVQGDSW